MESSSLPLTAQPYDPSAGVAPISKLLAVEGLAEDVAIRETLAVLAEDIATHAGFGVVVVAVRSSDTALRTVVCAGDDRVRAKLMDTTVPLTELHSLLAMAQSWGNLHFIPDARIDPGLPPQPWTWIDTTLSAKNSVADQDHWWTEKSWQPENALLAPLLRVDGEVLGLISVDLPRDGRRPQEPQRVALSVYARQAERTIAAAALRTAQTQQLELAQAARLIVREAGMQHQVSELLPRARAALISNFALHNAWIKSSPPVSTGDPSPDLNPSMSPPAGSTDSLPESVLPHLTRLAQWCWEEQVAFEVTGSPDATPGTLTADAATFTWFLHDQDVASALIVPLGSGDTRLGSMVLGRSATDRNWTTAEKAVALDIGHDIGRAIIHTMWFEAQERATTELRQHADYKRELLMTMSHELQTPLASMRAHIELVADDVVTGSSVGAALAAVERGSDRLTKLVNNMIWLARVDDPHRLADLTAVDLSQAVRLVTEDAAYPASVHLVNGPTRDWNETQGRELTVDVPDAPVWVNGTQSELVLACCNLVANALKYTDEGGRVHVQVKTDDHGAVELVVNDNGIGIDRDEQKFIFDDFYRSPSPQVRQRPGTGLGLSIVKRIVARHGGHITASSAPRATSFRLWLPPPV